MKRKVLWLVCAFTTKDFSRRTKATEQEFEPRELPRNNGWANAATSKKKNSTAAAGAAEKTNHNFIHFHLVFESSYFMGYTLTVTSVPTPSTYALINISGKIFAELRKTLSAKACRCAHESEVAQQMRGRRHRGWGSSARGNDKIARMGVAQIYPSEFVPMEVHHKRSSLCKRHAK